MSTDSFLCCRNKEYGDITDESHHQRQLKHWIGSSHLLLKYLTRKELPVPFPHSLIMFPYGVIYRQILQARIVASNHSVHKLEF